jgi:hypothetical protein
VTWDRDKELSAHAAFTVEPGVPVFFADPYSRWQRGTNENTNGLLRQYFPGTDLAGSGIASRRRNGRAPITRLHSPTTLPDQLTALVDPLTNDVD